MIDVAILVLDDDPDTLFLIEDSFKRSHLKHVSVFNNIEEFEASFTGRANVGIIDHYLGGKVGYEVMDRVIANHLSVVRPEFIIISGNHDPAIYAQYTKRGIHGYIDKNKRNTADFYEELIESTITAIDKVSRLVEYFEKWVGDKSII